MSEQWFERDPLWFKRAVFYEIHIRGFFDGNDDGSGDFRGLIEKLDYLEWLGVDCLWLLPFFASPLRDGGYDTQESSLRFVSGLAFASDGATLASVGRGGARVWDVATGQQLWSAKAHEQRSDGMACDLGYG